MYPSRITKVEIGFRINIHYPVSLRFVDEEVTPILTNGSLTVFRLGFLLELLCDVLRMHYMPWLNEALKYRQDHH